MKTPKVGFPRIILFLSVEAVLSLKPVNFKRRTDVVAQRRTSISEESWWVVFRPRDTSGQATGVIAISMFPKSNSDCTEPRGQLMRSTTMTARSHPEHGNRTCGAQPFLNTSQVSARLSLVLAPERAQHTHLSLFDRCWFCATVWASSGVSCESVQKQGHGLPTQTSGARSSRSQ